MSSKAVRLWFRTELVARVPTIPYKDTVNTTPDRKNLPDLWMTLEFDAASSERLTIGTNPIIRESGVVTVSVVGLSGRGDAVVVDAAESIRSAFTGVSQEIVVGAGVGTLRIDTPEPPNTDPTESGNWYLAGVSCAYTLDVARTA